MLAPNIELVCDYTILMDTKSLTNCLMMLTCILTFFYTIKFSLFRLGYHNPIEHLNRSHNK